MAKKNTIPDGWKNVSPVGQPIAETRFIAFKPPLKEGNSQQLLPEEKFSIEDLLAAVKDLNMELGIIIDLTSTTTYYDTKELPSSVEYKKLLTVELEVPDDPTILQFKKIVKKFKWENANNEKLIGVHCTNGINRTGYLVCRYLIDVEHWYPETAIQVFGDARGHHMDGEIFLEDLKTEPKRSNLGMKLWFADKKLLSRADNTDGHMDQFPNKEHSSSAENGKQGLPLKSAPCGDPKPPESVGVLPSCEDLALPAGVELMTPLPGKSLRAYDDGPNDLPEQIRLREFDFINKDPGQHHKPYHDHQFHFAMQPSLPQIRQKHFPPPQFHDNCQEEIEINDLKFSTRGPGHNFQPFEGHQLDDYFPGNVSGGDINMNCSQSHRHFADTPCYNHRPTDSQLSGGQGERQRPFYNQQSSDDFQSPLQDKNKLFLNKRQLEKLRLLSHCDISEKSQLKDFQNGRPEQRLNSFDDHSTHINEPYEEYSERSHHFPSHEYYAESPLLQRDYGSDNCSRTCRSDCPDDYRKIHPSDVINRGGKARFAPYYSYPTLHASSSHQELRSVSLHSAREHLYEVKRNMSQGKRLPVVTIDYNYGLPASEEEERAHYNSHATEKYILK